MPRMEAFRELSYAKAGPFAAPGDARQYYPQSAQDQLDATGQRAQGHWKTATPDLPRAMGVQEAAKIADLPIHLRGSHWTLGRRCPAPLPARDRGRKPAAAFPTDQSGRLQLAEWLTKPDHPLTSRVMANRIWRWHFGRGHRAFGGQFRTAGRAAHQPAAARLAGAAICGAGLVHQADAPHDHAFEAPTR